MSESLKLKIRAAKGCGSMREGELVRLELEMESGDPLVLAFPHAVVPKVIRVLLLGQSMALKVRGTEAAGEASVELVPAAIFSKTDGEHLYLGVGLKSGGAVSFRLDVKQAAVVAGECRRFVERF